MKRNSKNQTASSPETEGSDIKNIKDKASESKVQKGITDIKQGLHPRNPHRFQYDFKQLISSNKDLEKFIFVNQYKQETIDFYNPEAVKELNKSLLKHFYNVDYWEIPDNYLCPPVPGRADYIHYLADLLSENNNGLIPKGASVRGLDVGVGANCIYPIIGHRSYGWTFVGSDIDANAVNSANKIITSNKTLVSGLNVRLQKSVHDIFMGVINPDEKYDFTMCNPPFHASAEEAMAGAQRKLTNLGGLKGGKPILNFGGQNAELWYKGGEAAFVSKMIKQSAHFSSKCFWFSSLISKKDTLPRVYYELKKIGAIQVRTIDMAQGQKKSRIVAWTYLNEEKQKEWVQQRWK